jgi:hypothetical protein
MLDALGIKVFKMTIGVITVFEEEIFILVVDTPKLLRRIIDVRI